MDQAVQDLLVNWGYSHYISDFKDQGIDIEAFDGLNNDFIKQLTPSLGDRIKFTKHFSTYMQPDPVVLNISNTSNLNDVILDTVGETVFSSPCTSTITAASKISPASSFMSDFIKDRPLGIFIVLLSFLGVAAGAHRLWAHKAYTASTQLRFFLAFCQTLAGCGSIYEWVQWHRLHHKHFNTVLDPYNPSKGWFYAHIVSNTLKLSPAQEKELEQIDMSDIEEDKIVMFQKKYYIPLYVIVTLLLTINAPAEYWGEDILGAVFVAGWFKYFIIMHLTWLIHSATKIWGLEPGEKYPCDTNLVFILSKNYWLSYHYLAPWDYQTSEFSKYGTDCVTKFIRVCAALEYATDLRTIDSASVRKALFSSLKNKKDIAEALLEEEKASKVPADHYLTPSEFQ